MIQNFELCHPHGLEALRELLGISEESISKRGNKKPASWTGLSSRGPSPGVSFLYSSSPWSH
jgi:hypothetical protein